MSLDYLILEKKDGYGKLGWLSFYGHEARLDTFIACLSGKYEPQEGELELHSTGKDTSIILQGKNTVNTLYILQSNRDSIIRTGKTKSGKTPILLVDTTDGVVTISDFVKTELFGGGSGRGAGTVQTIYQEAGQCVVCSAKALLPDLKSVKDIEDIGTQVELGEGLSKKEVLSKVKELCKTESWNNSMINTADLLLKKGFRNAVFHYGSKANPETVENTILEAFKRCKVPGSLGKDKWNPADIWATQNGYEKYIESIAGIPDGSSIQVLNSIMKEAFRNKSLVGISLKKVGSKYPTYTEHNTGTEERDIVTNIHVTNISCNPDPRKQSGMSVTVGYEEDGEHYEDTLVFRKSSRSLRVEKKEDSRKNREALHGNMGLEPLLHYLNKYGLHAAQSAVEDIKQQCVEESCQRLKDDCVVSYSTGGDAEILEAELRGGQQRLNVFDIFNSSKVAHTLASLYKKYFNMTEDQLLGLVLDENSVELAVKYTCLYILNELGVNSFEDINNQNLNSLVLDCYRYASSETPISCPFVKIS